LAHRALCKRVTALSTARAVTVGPTIPVGIAAWLIANIQMIGQTNASMTARPRRPGQYGASGGGGGKKNIHMVVAAQPLAPHAALLVDACIALRQQVHVLLGDHRRGVGGVCTNSAASG
jgi:hypothetical protein